MMAMLDKPGARAYRASQEIREEDMMEQASANLDRVLVLEMVRVTEAAAIAASRLVGRGDEKAADAAAVEATLFWRLAAVGTVQLFPLLQAPQEAVGKALLTAAYLAAAAGALGASVPQPPPSFWRRTCALMAALYHPTYLAQGVGQRARRRAVSKTRVTLSRPRDRW